MKKVLFFLTVVLMLALSSTALANNTCKVDEYGCYVMDEDNHQSYIMFWSETARKYIMGSLSDPYTAVVTKPAGVTDVMDLGPAEFSFTCLDLLGSLDAQQFGNITTEEECRAALDDVDYCIICLNQCVLAGIPQCVNYCEWACR